MTDCETKPVTVLLSRTVRPGAESAWEAALTDHLERVQRLPGHLGVNVIQPVAGARRWTFIFKFQTQEQADAWRDSEIQRAWNERALELTEGEPRIQVTCGLETWFTTPDLGVVAPPPRWKMAVSTWLVIYPTITALLLAVGPQLQPLPVALRTLVLTAVLVPLMTFVLMPSVTRALRGWLFA
ncbi:MAG: antibiotic biosynthesis monooxygenase [Planctomycetota bacterium]